MDFLFYLRSFPEKTGRADDNQQQQQQQQQQQHSIFFNGSPSQRSRLIMPSRRKAAKETHSSIFKYT
jgi:hypothetical protein